MKALRVFLIVCVVAGAGCNAVNSTEHAELDAEQIEQTVGKVIQWQFENHQPESWNRSWQDATLFTGVVEAAAALENETYWELARAWGEQNRWGLGGRAFHADDQAVGNVYLELYRHFEEPHMIEAFRESVDRMEVRHFEGRELWWWSDALFMAPPAIARLAEVTGERQYLSLLNGLYWDTHSFLYNPEHRLFFRDKSFFGKLDASGNPIFWSRGNGWVVAGLARILHYMPEENLYYDEYRDLLVEMLDKLVAIQPEDGLWRTNLLSPEIYPEPETSGTAFFCYALAWSINRGMLSGERYVNAFRSSWNGLVGQIDSQGKLGYVQSPDDSPASVEKNNSAVYGTGAFLLAASEAYRMAVSGEN